MTVNHLTEQVIGAAIRVHRELGPGLLESAYVTCLAWELVELGIPVERQKQISVVYRNRRLDCGYRIDMLVDGRVLVEVKSVERLERVFTAQVLTYLKLSGCEVGLLINFNVPLLKEGVRRLVLGYAGDLPHTGAGLR
jgi:GxxExxY protein